MASYTIVGKYPLSPFTFIYSMAMYIYMYIITLNLSFNNFSTSCHKLLTMTLYILQIQGLLIYVTDHCRLEVVNGLIIIPVCNIRKVTRSAVNMSQSLISRQPAYIHTYRCTTPGQWPKVQHNIFCQPITVLYKEPFDPSLNSRLLPNSYSKRWEQELRNERWETGKWGNGNGNTGYYNTGGELQNSTVECRCCAKQLKYLLERVQAYTFFLSDPSGEESRKNRSAIGVAWIKEPERVHILIGLSRSCRQKTVVRSFLHPFNYINVLISTDLACVPIL